eukprot:2109783-Rhodomonas_salina.4
MKTPPQEFDQTHKTQSEKTVEGRGGGVSPSSWKPSQKTSADNFSPARPSPYLGRSAPIPAHPNPVERE